MLKLKRMPYYLESSVPGSFAAGDVRHRAVNRFASLWAKVQWQ